VGIYRILGESAAQSRLDVAGATGLTPLVGRDAEVALLLERWAHSQAGAGQVVLLRGEAGIGKTHLATALGYAACLQGYSVLFASAIDVINTLAAAKNAGRLKAELKKYTKPALLILD
jgi:DNA replication protein DnaC